MDESELTVANLNSVGLERWFEVGRKPNDLPTAVAKLREQLSPDASKSPFRIVALDGKNRIRAKVGGYITRNGRITFWAVYHRNREGPATRRKLTRLLIDSCMDLAKSTPHVKFLETKPAYDTPDRRIFVSSLRERGFREIAVSHLYKRNLAHLRPPFPPPLPGLERLSSDELDPDVLGRLLVASQADTLDRIQRDDLSSGRERLEELRASTAPISNRSLWSVAAVLGRPIGLILCAASGPSESPLREATIVELGILPEFRGRKIGTWLVDEILSILKALKTIEVQALIDDENIPSRRLHINAGFKRSAGSFCTWRHHIVNSYSRADSDVYS
jgi:ribosomal protein S18 acetylase RimI-like enzyme